MIFPPSSSTQRLKCSQDTLTCIRFKYDPDQGIDDKAKLAASPLLYTVRDLGLEFELGWDVKGDTFTFRLAGLLFEDLPKRVQIMALTRERDEHSFQRKIK